MAENRIVPAPSNRWVLLHYHIFKNAGSTIEWIFRRRLGDRFATLHGPDEDSVVAGPELDSFLGGNPEIAAISSHHLRYPLPAIANVILFDLCFFRDPLRRLASMYRYFRATGASDELAQCARTSTAPEFFDLLLRDHPHLINDVQVNVMANGGVYTRPPTAGDLRIAQERLRQIAVLGVVEMFDESAVTAEYFLRPTFPELQFEYLAQNVTTPLDREGPPPQDRFRAEIGTTRFMQLERLNRLDTQLLAFAKDELLRRFEMVPERNELMTSLRQRCETLRAAEAGSSPATPVFS
jgi:hypothetical protein